MIPTLEDVLKVKFPEDLATEESTQFLLSPLRKVQDRLFASD